MGNRLRCSSYLEALDELAAELPRAFEAFSAYGERVETSLNQRKTPLEPPWSNDPRTEALRDLAGYAAFAHSQRAVEETTDVLASFGELVRAGFLPGFLQYDE